MIFRNMSGCLKSVLLAVLILIGGGVQFGAAKAEAEGRAYFAGGCFWCVESDFERLRGVYEVISGYTGGDTENSSYKAIKAGGTGHYEAVEIQYHPDQVSYGQLLNAFFRSIDPTDAEGQFCDRGDAYRTAVFVSNATERRAAERARRNAERELGQEIVTPILDANTFFPAESYHQDFYKQTAIIVTRRGPRTKANAYKFYRKGCGRDARVIELWGEKALFAKANS